MNKIQKIKDLTAYLNRLRDKYYNESQSLVSDFEYDRLYDELEALEKETGFVMANSPTHSVGYEVKSELEKVEHSHPMLSLDKTKSVEKLKEFAGNKDCILSLKLDGLSVLLTYENGKLIQAETRGDGYTGELITSNAMVFDNIPLQIDYTGHFEIEGEAIITYADFEKINSKIQNENKKYKNPRNLASGSVRQLDSGVAAKRHLKFIAWKVPTFSNYMALDLNTAKEMGFDIVPFYMWYHTQDDEPVENLISNLKSKAEYMGYPIDGLVVSYNDVQYGLSLGMTGHHPRHSYAFKFSEDEEETELIDVEYTMGKTGILTPTAVFKPVELAGTTVGRASLHNLTVMDVLSDGKIWHKNMKVTVFKANEIIPQISSVEIDETYPFKEDYLLPPYACPICGSLTERVKENDSEFLLCSNPDCQGKLLGKLTHAVSRDAFNIDGLSEQTLDKFINLGWLTSIEDIYHLAKYKDRMIHLDGFGKKSVEKLLSSIEKSRETTLQRLLYSLSIPLIGKSASKAISKYCNGSYEVFTEHMALSRGKVFLEIDDFGEKMWEKLDEFWSKNCHLVTKMVKNELKVGDKTTPNESLISSDILSGKTFVITGTLEKFKNRNELVAAIESRGGKVSGSVSAKTHYLINNDQQSSSSKNKNARKLNIPIISEEEFINMIS